MARIFSAVIVAFFLSLIGCTTPQKVHLEKIWREDNGKIKVLTTIAMIEDMVSCIGGERVDTLSLIIGDLDPHSYELVKGDDEKFQIASIIFYNGLGLEHGLSLRQKLAAHPRAVGLGDLICKRNPHAALLVDGQQDPHIWMDMSLWAETIPIIVNELSALAPEYAREFSLRGRQLEEDLLKADSALLNIMQAIPEKNRYLVTSHDAFNYFARRYLNTPGRDDWKERFRAPEGLAPEAQLSVRDLGEILTHIKNYDITTLFPESNVSGDSLKKLAFTCAYEGYTIHLSQVPLYGDTMHESGSYIQMMMHNGNTIARELNHEK